GFRVQQLASEEGILRDVAVPIFEGRAGVVRVGMTEERLERTLTRTTEQLLLLIAGVSLLGVLAAYLPTRILTRPLLELRDLTRAVGREDFTPRARVRFPDEIGQLAAAFNAMVENLDRADTERSRLLDELRAKEQMRRELLQKVISAQEEERKRVARELHDETGQSLASLMVGLKVLESQDRLEEVKGKVADLRSVVDKVLRDIHDLAWELRPSLLDSLGLAAAIQRSAEEYRERPGLRIDCQVTDLDQKRLPPEVETAAYRIVQEALTNVAKHAQATRASVVLRHRGTSLLAIVEDDGKGFDVDAILGAAPIEKRLGLFGMSERAALLGGRFSLESTPGKGTTVFVEIPLPGAP
ncbi:MAG: sensor histidine kinase, partial [Candidatus Rokubacteria bacterium]|nr:sensor histidine kinase [Candidatus Rokubacteria bacterium]